jgi:aminoglycoside phosphotransferase (APT) family kinase protein
VSERDDAPLEGEGLRARLADFCRAHIGDDAALGAVQTMPGHAGVSFGFDVRAGGGVSRHVVRLPPPGVRHEGPSDVLRQAAVLRALRPTAVPVAPVSWAGDDARWFGRPYMVTEWLPGATVALETGGRLPDGLTAEAAAEQATGVLAELHRLDPSRIVPGFDPGTPVDDVVRWDRFAERAADPALVALVPTVRARLLAATPGSPRIGVRHGDFQWSNLLFDGGRLVAVLDWELASVGPVLHDLGWLSVFSDAESWHMEGMWSATATPERIAELYARCGAEVGDLTWHRALAGYTFAIIAAFNLMLHRRGKRVDPHYEVLAPSIPRLLERALEVLDGAA